MDKDNIRINEIRRLLRRYYDGTSTCAEEEELIEFFRNAASIPEDLEPDRLLFVELGEMQLEESPLPFSLEKRISEALASVAAEETDGADTVSESLPHGRRIHWTIWLTTAAACIALVFSLPGLLNPNRGNSNLNLLAKDTTLFQPTLDPSHQSAEYTDTALMRPIASVADNSARNTPRPKTEAKTAPSESSISSANHSADHTLSATSTEGKIVYEEYPAEIASPSPTRRVVDDPLEAEALMSAVFAEMEGNINLEKARVIAICDNMDMSLDNLYNYDY